MSNENGFYVTWSFDVDLSTLDDGTPIATPYHAAQAAWEALTREGSIAHIFTVIDSAGTEHTVDLDSSDERITAEAVHAWQQGHPITDLQARVIATAWHGGQTSALYSFASTGNTRPLSDLIGEIDTALYVNADTPNREALEALKSYVTRVSVVGHRGTVVGWNNLSW